MAPKIESKTPAGQVNHAHTIVWSVRVSAMLVHHETDRGSLFIVDNWTAHSKCLYRIYICRDEWEIVARTGYMKKGPVLKQVHPVPYLRIRD